MREKHKNCYETGTFLSPRIINQKKRLFLRQ